jgi:predicted transcriptional regulator of viral defense system
VNIFELRKLIGQEIADYNMIISSLHQYSHPRRNISEWIKKGELIRVKKGLYVFGPKASQGPYSIEVLANLIYGPSALSMQYALYYHGLIPEQPSHC